MKKTDWFPPNIKPVHIGVYETQFKLPAEKWAKEEENKGYSYWNGKEWSNQRLNPEKARRYNDSYGAIQKKKWRGFTEKQS